MIEINKKGTSSYSFKLKTDSGHTVLRSVDHSNTEEIAQTIETLRPVKNNIIKVERRTNNEGFFLFDVKNAKGQLVGHSQNYTSEAGMENGIKNLINNMDSLLKQ